MRILQYQNAHRKNEEGIQMMCKALGAEYEKTDSQDRVTSWVSERDGDEDILWLPHTFTEDVPSSLRVMYGPHFFVFPEGDANGISGTAESRSAFYNVLSPWNEIVHLYFCPFPKIPFKPVPFAINVDRFSPAPASENIERTIFLLYIKERDPVQVKQFERMLKNKRVFYTKVSYDAYQEDMYITLLRRSKGMFVIGRHESQGFAFQEAMSCDVPLMVWDVTSMHQEHNGNGFSYTEYENDPLLASSVPYWDSRCGEIFTDPDKFEETYQTFTNGLRDGKYKPREYIMETLSPSVCAKRMIDAFKVSE